MVRKISRLLLHQISSEIWFTKSLLIFRTTKYQNYKATLMGTGTTENNICSHIFQDSKFSLHTRWFSHDSAIAICLFFRFPRNVQNHAIVTNQQILSFLIINMYMCTMLLYRLYISIQGTVRSTWVFRTDKVCVYVRRVTAIHLTNKTWQRKCKFICFR